jgi:multidrug efflux pump subunit AcrA (membrane-fusion protein)
MSDKKIRRYAWIALIVAIALGVWGEISRVLARSELIKENADAAIPTVTTTTAEPSGAGEELVLPGAVQAFMEAPIYARTSGYLKSWNTDIGTLVTKGQLLAQIETPEVDQQLTQAQADLATARANENLSKSTNVRWQGLLATQSVSKQDADEKAGDAAAKTVAADSAAANVARLGIVQACGCAFHRRHYRTQYRRWGVDQRRPKHRNGTVSHRGYACAAHFCTCAGALRGGNQARPRSRFTFCGAP